MRSVGLKVLKNTLSDYIRLATAGERVLVTDRDRVVAEIVAPPGWSLLNAHALLASGVREGWLALPELAGGEPPPRKPVLQFRQLIDALQHDHEDQ